MAICSPPFVCCISTTQPGRGPCWLRCTGGPGGVLTLLAGLEAVAPGRKEPPLCELEGCVRQRMGRRGGYLQPQPGDQLCCTARQRKRGHSAAGGLGSRRAEGLPEDLIYFLASPKDGRISFIHECALGEPTVSRARLRMRESRVWPAGFG